MQRSGDALCLLVIRRQQVQPADEDKATDTLPEVDVWAEEAEQESDVFVPTESISADASIAFPSDI